MGSKSKPSNQTEVINPYEMKRMQNLEANVAKMKAKGFNKSILSKTLQEKYDRVSRNLFPKLYEQEEHVDCEIQDSSQIPLDGPMVMHGKKKPIEAIGSSRSLPSKKQKIARTSSDQSIEHLNDVTAVSGVNQRDQRQMNCLRDKSGKTTLTQTVPMAEFMKLRKREQQQKSKQGKTNQGHEGQAGLVQQKENELSFQGQANHETHHVEQHQGQSKKKSQRSHASLNQPQKSYCAPGSMSRYTNMKKNQNLTGQRINNISDMQQPHDDLHLSDDEMDLTEDNGDYHDISADAPNALDANVNAEKKKHRGRTFLANIHGRTLEERDVIILNDLHQVVGPTRRIVGTFAHFIGTLARNPKFAPLNILSWTYMPTKDKIWEYIQSKYIVPEVGKEEIISNIGTKWRTNKSRLKKLHFSIGATMEEMFARRPKDIPEPQFRELIEYWCTEEAQEESKRNKANRANQTDMHTLGPTSLAMLRHEMQQNDPEKRCPSQADVYIGSRERKVGHTYLTQNDETLQNIEKMKALQSLDDGNSKSDKYYGVITKKEHNGRLRLYGHGVTKASLKTKDPNNPYIFPPVFLESISQQLDKKLEEIDKRREEQFEQKLVAMLAKIREANPGVDLVIPDFPTNEGDASSSSHQT